MELADPTTNRPSGAPRRPAFRWPVALRTAGAAANRSARRVGALTAIVVAAGVWLRYWAARRGANWDMESFQIVARLYAQGGVAAVYGGTPRYNYGPTWAVLIGEIGRIVGTEGAFRYALAAMLTAADLVTFSLLTRAVGLAAGAAFFLAPTAVLITGYHCQIEPLALAFALGGVLLYGERFDGRLTRRKVGGLVLLGVSLTAKHFAFAFPLWIAVKERRGMRAVSLALPLAVFGASFAPFLSEASEGIRVNVFGYQGEHYNALWQAMPGHVRHYFNSTALWWAVLAFGASAARDVGGLQSFGWYCVLLLASTPALANQYFALLSLPWALNRTNVPLAATVVLVGLYFASSPSNLNIDALRVWTDHADLERPFVYRLATALLWASILWEWTRRGLRSR